jgi:hypothetical protein
MKVGDAIREITIGDVVRVTLLLAFLAFILTAL